MHRRQELSGGEGKAYGLRPTPSIPIKISGGTGVAHDHLQSPDDRLENNMNLYFAPMEVTGYVYRNAHRACFGGVDKYFTPFCRPIRTTGLPLRGEGREAGAQRGNSTGASDSHQPR